MDEAFIVLDKLGPLPVPQIDIDNDEDKGCGEVASGTLVSLI